jgi:hypothetical protein
VHVTWTPTRQCAESVTSDTFRTCAVRAAIAAHMRTRTRDAPVSTAARTRRRCRVTAASTVRCSCTRGATDERLRSPESREARTELRVCAVNRGVAAGTGDVNPGGRHSSNMFDSDIVNLECGHTGRSWGGIRARCRTCGTPRDEGARMREFDKLCPRCGVAWKFHAPGDVCQPMTPPPRSRPPNRRPRRRDRCR